MAVATEKIVVHCPQCGKNLLVPESAAGKQIRCAACSKVFDAASKESPFATPPAGFSAPTQPLAPLSTPGFSPQPSTTSSAWSPVPTSNPYASPAPIAPPTPVAPARNYNHGFGWEHRAWDKGAVGGLIMMAIAVVWFFAGLILIDRIFFYPPILFVFGLVGFLRGICTGNLNGE